MFSLKKHWGDHKIYTFNTEENDFLHYFQELFGENQLDMLHLKSSDYNSAKDMIFNFKNGKD